MNLLCTIGLHRNIEKQEAEPVDMGDVATIPTHDWVCTDCQEVVDKKYELYNAKKK